LALLKSSSGTIGVKRALQQTTPHLFGRKIGGTPTFRQNTARFAGTYEQFATDAEFASSVRVTFAGL
jgi:hypothetical protein